MEQCKTRIGKYFIKQGASNPEHFNSYLETLQFWPYSPSRNKSDISLTLKHMC